LGDDCPHGTRVCAIADGLIRWSADVAIPYAPMLGCIATAPDGGPPSTLNAGPFGGNMDIVEVCPGNTIFLPAFVPGGLLYLGDAHAAMGHGELSGSGLEMPAETVITVDRVEGKRLANPRIESPDEIMTVATGCPMERSMAEAYSQLVLWMEAEFGWDLLAPERRTVLRWDCHWGKPIEWSGPITVEILKDGISLDLSSNPWGTWIASPKARTVLERVAPDAVQYFPLSIPGGAEPFFVANIIKRVACLDEKLSYVEHWERNNRVRPDKAGQVSTILDLHVDPARAAGEHIFRLDERVLHVLVSRTMNEALEQAGVTGVKFQDATSPEIAEFRIRFAERQRKRNAT
jgi:hypothetical protein